MSLPMWLFSPTWSERVVETLAWRTDVLVSPTGTEQRTATRITPRRTIECSVLTAGRERRQLEEWLALYGASTFSLPLFTEGVVFDAPLRLGQAVIPLPFATLRLSGVRECCLVSAQRQTVISIVSVSESSVTTLPLSRSWPAGTRCFPLANAVLTDTPSISRYSDDVARFQCRFRLQQANPLPVVKPAVMYRGYPVLTQLAHWTEDRRAEYQRLLLELDNQTGLPFRTDTAKRPFYLQYFDWTVAGYAQQMALRQLLYYLRGRQRALWVSTQVSDFDVIAAQNATLTVRRLLTETALSAGRKDIQVACGDGELRHYRILSSTLEGEHEILQLDGVLPALHRILRVSFLVLSRQNSDEITWTHHTDTDGVAQVSTTFRGVNDEL